MTHSTLFLPGISHRLFGRQPRSRLDRLRQQSKHWRQSSLSRLCEIFGPWLPAAVLAPVPKGDNSRQRLYPVSLHVLGVLESGVESGVFLPRGRPQSPGLVCATGQVARQRHECLLPGARAVAALAADGTSSNTGRQADGTDHCGWAVASKWWTVRAFPCPTPPPTRKLGRNPPLKNQAAVFPSSNWWLVFVWPAAHCSNGSKARSRNMIAACSRSSFTLSTKAMWAGG